MNNGRVGILFDDNFKGTKGNLDLENNYFSYNGVLDLQNKGDQAVSIGKNFAARKCYRVGMKYTFRIKSRQSGGKYYFSVVDKYGNAISDLPNFSAKLTVNGKTYTVTFIDGKAFINGGSGANGIGGSGGNSLTRHHITKLGAATVFADGAIVNNHVNITFHYLVSITICLGHHATTVELVN